MVDRGAERRSASGREPTQAQAPDSRADSRSSGTQNERKEEGKEAQIEQRCAGKRKFINRRFDLHFWSTNPTAETTLKDTYVAGPAS